MQIFKGLGLCAVACLMLTANAAMAASSGGNAISIDFIGGDTPMASSETAGVTSEANWNDATGASSTSPLNLMDSTGAATPVTVTWKSDNVWEMPIADTPGNFRMMKGYLDTGSEDPTTVTFQGLPAGTYNIYVYVDGDNGREARTGIYQLSGAGIATSSINLTDAANANFSGTFTQGNNSSGNYVLFTNVALSGGFTLTATPGASTDVYMRAPVNGIQIVPASTSPDFVLSVTPSSQTVSSSGTATYSVNVNAANGFAGVVSLNVSGLPGSAVSSFAPPTINGSGESTLTVSTASNATMTITGTSGALTHSVTASALVTTAASGSAAISIDFVGSGTAMASSEVAGVVAMSNWNDALGAQSSSPQVLFDDSGNTTSASISWKSDNIWETVIPDEPGNYRMMKGYLDNGSGDPTGVTVSGLSAGTYNIYVYAEGDNGSATRTGTYELSGPGIPTTSIGLTDAANTSFSGSFTPASSSSGNYVLFANVPVSNGFTLTATPAASSDQYQRAAVNGIQIVPAGPVAPNFALAATPGSQQVVSSGNASYSITVSPVGGFSGSVSFSVSGLPSGVAPNFSPATSTSSTTLSISVPTGTSVGSYPLAVTGTSGSLTQSVSITLVVEAQTTQTAAAGGYYVSPTGTPSGDGSVGNPWDLQTALNQPAAVQPGSTIWLLGGSYGTGTTLFTSSLNGTSGQPIVVRQYPGAHATIDGGLVVNGNYSWFWGFEVTNAPAIATRISGTVNAPCCMTDGIDVYGSGTDLINLVVHDTQQGIGFWSAGLGGEIYGSLVYNNGWQGTDRGHGHGIYTQNTTVTKTIDDNILFQGFGEGIQCYGSGSAPVNNYVFDGNTIFNSGSLEYGDSQYNLLVAGGNGGPQNIQVTNTYTYDSSDTGLSSLSWPFDSTAGSLTATNNYWIGGNPAIQIDNWTSATYTNNTAFSTAPGYYDLFAQNLTPGAYTWKNNAYYSTSGYFAELNNSSISFSNFQSSTGLDAGSSFTTQPPTGTWIFVRPNQFETGRANVTVYNWGLANSVSVDLSGVLAVGSQYVIQNAQNFYGPAAVSGTYQGGLVSIPMTGLTVSPVVGTIPNPQPGSVGPQFGAFVVLTVSPAP